MRAGPLKCIFLIFLLFSLFSSCQTTHPRKSFVHSSFKSGDVVKIVVFPFIASRYAQMDVSQEACSVLDNVLRLELAKRTDYRFIPMTTAIPALEAAGLQPRLKQWLKSWEKHEEIDTELFDELAQVLRADAVLVGIVDQVQGALGATITIIEIENGITLYKASDEINIVRISSGFVTETRREYDGAPVGEEISFKTRSYRTKRSKDAAEEVVEALVSKIPARNKNQR